MLRKTLIGLTLLVAAGTSAQANEIATIRSGDTAQVSLGQTSAIAFHDARGDAVQLTDVFTEVDGDVMRARVVLQDGQVHTLNLPVDEDGTLVHRYAFVRNGDVVDLWARKIDTRTKLASR